MSMNVMQSSFATNDPFSFKITYKDAKTEKNERPFHFHEWYEIVYVYKGNGTFLIDRSIQTMEAGNVFIIPSNTIHRAIPNPDHLVSSTAVYFDPALIYGQSHGESFHLLSIFDHVIRKKQYKFSVSVFKRKEMEQYLQKMHDEMIESSHGFKHVILIQLQSLLLFLNRNIEDLGAFERNSHSGPTWMNEVLLEIEQKYMTSLALKQLAEGVNVSAAHLSRVFKQMTGMNVSTYILTKKIVHAKQQLLQTEKKVTEIAYESGFSSMPYFHRTFKKFTGKTPSAYRGN